MVWKREIIGKLSKWIGKAIISSFFDSIQFNSEIKFLNWIAFRKKFVIKLTANSMYDPESPKDRAVLRVTLHIKANIWILNLITHKACCWWETLSLNAILSRSYFFFTEGLWAENVPPTGKLAWLSTSLHWQNSPQGISNHVLILQSGLLAHLLDLIEIL